MEEADGILFLSLRQAGCSIPEEFTTVADLTPNGIMAVCLRCLALIKGQGTSNLQAGEDLEKPPKETSARFRLSNNLALQIQQLGFRNEISFHQFLYPSDSDTRALFRFLVDKVAEASQGSQGAKSKRVGRRRSSGLRSKKSAAPQDGQGQKDNAVRTAGRQGLGHLSGVGEGNNVAVWQDAQNLGLDNGTIVSEADGRQKDKVLSHTEKRRRSSWTPSMQMKPRALIAPSVIRRLASSAAADRSSEIITWGTVGNFANREADRAIAEAEAAQCAAREREVGQLQADVAEAVASTEQLAAESAKLQSKNQDILRQMADGEASLRAEEDEANLMEGAAGLLLDNNRSPSEILAKLEEVLGRGEAKLAALEAEWEEVKRPLEEERTKLQMLTKEQQSEEDKLIEQIRELRAESRAMAAQIHDREEESVELLEELDRRPKNASRTMYLRRMTEIIKNIKKQDAGIADIIADTRALQRESNLAQEKLQRTHALVDEMIFRDAKKDPVCRQTYKLLNVIHENFGALGERAAEINRVSRDVVDLEAKLEALSKRHVDIARVTGDLEAVSAENRALEQRIKDLRVLAT